MHQLNKILLYALLFCIFPVMARAQVYYNVNVFTGTQTVGGITATVSTTGTVTTGGGNNCGIVPWWAHSTNAAVKIVFSNPVSVVRSHLTWVNSGDTMNIKMNGTLYTVTNSNLSYYQGNCITGPMSILAHNGEICGTTCGTQSSGQFDASPGFGVDSIELTVRVSGCGGIGFDFWFTNDCPGGVIATALRDTLCSNDTLHLFADTTAVSATATYSWSGPNGFSSTQLNPILNGVSSLDSGLYTVTVTDTGYCVYNSTLNVVENPHPVVTASSNSPLCPGDSLKLISGTYINALYSWTGPGSFSSSAQNPVLTPFAISDTGIYDLVTSFNGCSASTLTHVTLNSLPTPVITYNSPVCPGDTLKLNANTSTSGVTYSWTGPNGFLSTLQNPAIPNALAINTGTYTVTVTNGCSGTASAAVAVSPVLGPPAIVISVSPGDTICAGDNITLSAVSSNAGNAPTYQWKKNGVDISGATAAVFTMGSLSNGDIITCKVTSNAPCQAVDTTTSASIHMHVISLAPPNVWLSTYPVHYVPGDTVTFTGHVATGSAGLSYRWMKNGIPIPGANTIFYTSSNLSPGDSICLIVHSSVPCTFPDSVITCLQLTTGVDNINPGPASLNVYPNPNRGNFTISGRIPGSDQVTIEVINTLGQPIYVEAIQPEHHIFEKQLILGDIAPGVYTLLLKTENEYIINKIIIKP